MPLERAVPVAAYYFTATDTFRVEFDRQLEAGVLEPSNWIMTIDAAWRWGDVVTAAGKSVTGTTVVYVEGPAVNTIRYDPPPFDVTRPDGVAPTVAFTDFPLQIV